MVLLAANRCKRSSIQHMQVERGVFHRVGSFACWDAATTLQRRLNHTAQIILHCTVISNKYFDIYVWKSFGFWYRYHFNGTVVSWTTPSSNHEGHITKPIVDISYNQECTLLRNPCTLSEEGAQQMCLPLGSSSFESMKQTLQKLYFYWVFCPFCLASAHSG